MTDTEKLKVIDRIIVTAFSLQPDENKGLYFEGVIASIEAVLTIEEAAE